MAGVLEELAAEGFKVVALALRNLQLAEAEAYAAEHGNAPKARGWTSSVRCRGLTFNQPTADCSCSVAQLLYIIAWQDSPCACIHAENVLVSGLCRHSRRHCWTDPLFCSRWRGKTAPRGLRCSCRAERTASVLEGEWAAARRKQGLWLRPRRGNHSQ